VVPGLGTRLATGDPQRPEKRPEVGYRLVVQPAVDVPALVTGGRYEHVSALATEVDTWQPRRRVLDVRRVGRAAIHHVTAATAGLGGQGRRRFEPLSRSPRAELDLTVLITVDVEVDHYDA